MHRIYILQINELKENFELMMIESGLGEKSRNKVKYRILLHNYMSHKKKRTAWILH